MSVAEAVKQLREPHYTFARTPNAVRQSLADLLEKQAAALVWALPYLEGYDHVGTGSAPPEKVMRDYVEKLEAIRVMCGLPRETTMKLGNHFESST